MIEFQNILINPEQVITAKVILSDNGTQVKVFINDEVIYSETTNYSATAIERKKQLKKELFDLLNR
jgi:hypothetical protein